MLEVDGAQGVLRHTVVDSIGGQSRMREIAFDEVTHIFVDSLVSSDPQLDSPQNLIIKYNGHPGRLDALTLRDEEVAPVRDYLLAEVTGKPAPPVVTGVRSFIERARWETGQRV